MRTCEVHSSKVTHSGRHAGTSEAFYLQLSIDDLRHLGRWCMGVMECAYLPQLPINGAFIMAHFKQNEQYFLERDLVCPPLELQRLLFPWIEKSFDNDFPDKTWSWIEECNSDMLGENRLSPRDSDLHWTPQSGSSSTREACNNINSSVITDRMSFLQSLVRMRRVILQDAALYLKPNEQGQIMSNSVIERLPHIFKSDLFQKFQSELLAAIEDYRGRPNILDTTVSIEKQNVADAFDTIGGRLQELTRLQQLQRQELEQKLEEKLERQQQESERQNKAIENKLDILIQVIAQQTQPHFRFPQAGPSVLYTATDQHIPCSSSYPTYQGGFSPGPSPSLASSSWFPPPNLINTPALASNVMSMPSPQQPIQNASQKMKYGMENTRNLQDTIGMSYQMKEDNGKLTLKEAWDEFFGPISQAKSLDARWPYVAATDRRYRRRAEFVRQVQEEARLCNRECDNVLDELVRKFPKKSVHYVSSQLRSNHDKGVPVVPVEAAASTLNEHAPTPAPTTTPTLTTAPTLITTPTFTTTSTPTTHTSFTHYSRPPC